MIALDVGTRRPFFRKRPGTLLAGSSAVMIAAMLAVPFPPFARVVGFVPLPVSLVAALCGITVLYVLAAEGTKRWFFRPRPARAAHA